MGGQCCIADAPAGYRDQDIAANQWTADTVEIGKRMQQPEGTAMTPLSSPRGPLESPPELKGSIGEGPNHSNHSNHSDHSNIRILSK